MHVMFAFRQGLQERPEGWSTHFAYEILSCQFQILSSDCEMETAGEESLWREKEKELKTGTYLLLSTESVRIGADEVLQKKMPARLGRNRPAPMGEDFSQAIEMIATVSQLALKWH